MSWGRRNLDNHGLHRKGSNRNFHANRISPRRDRYWNSGGLGSNGLSSRDRRQHDNLWRFRFAPGLVLDNGDTNDAWRNDWGRCLSLYALLFSVVSGLNRRDAAALPDCLRET